MNRLFYLLIVFALTGCASKGTSVILLDNPDGSVGQVKVMSQGGEQHLNSARQETTIKDPATLPTPPRVVSQNEIDRDFGATLQALPLSVETFVLYFESGTPNLDEQSRELPEKIIATIVQRESRDIRINGHSDRVGTREDNARLSLQRAQAVRDILIDRGVNPAIIQVASHGEGNPLIPTADEISEPRNRRVEVLVR